jgi:hypothetical protein
MFWEAKIKELSGLDYVIWIYLTWVISPSICGLAEKN